MISIIDYGMGNLRSVQKAFEYLGHDAIITSDKNAINDASHIVLPGVGAFKDAIDALRKHELISSIQSSVNSGKPFLGICLGMQLLFQRSYENGEYEGLSILEGDVVKFDIGSEYKVPHIGWNKINIKNGKIFNKYNKDQYVYFVHSYHVVPNDESIIATTTNYGYDFTSAVCKDNIFATQFHPEKSGKTGLNILKNFGELS